MATLGLRDLFIAPITVSGEEETYGPVRRLAKAIKAEMSVEVAEDKIFADDGTDKIIREFTGGTLKLNVNDLSTEDTAALLGQTIGAGGVIFAGESDDPPYFAVAFRAKKPGGIYRYVWLYKVKFKIPNENYETKGDSIKITTPEIEGKFIKRDKDGMWKADYTGKPDTPVAADWFEKVAEYTGPTEPAED